MPEVEPCQPEGGSKNEEASDKSAERWQLPEKDECHGQHEERLGNMNNA